MTERSGCLARTQPASTMMQILCTSVEKTPQLVPRPGMVDDGTTIAFLFKFIYGFSIE